jgi:methylated-DNA-[protein]-cysteine S-methyltransferase
MMGSMTDRTATFDTALGRCAVSWSDSGISGVWLPRRSGYSAPSLDSVADAPAFVREAVDGMRAVLAGERRDLHGVPLDERGIDPFRRSVYAATRDIEPGTTQTYGQVAKAIGRPDGARDVGTALSQNPFPIVVPCHRVIAANGALTGFAAPGGIETKRRMLELEGAPGFGQQILFG